MSHLEKKLKIKFKLFFTSDIVGRNSNGIINRKTPIMQIETISFII